MLDIINIFYIKIFIKLTETIQALTNIDIYSIIRIKKEDNLKLFLDKNFHKSYLKWRNENNNLSRDFLTIHNISYNHWIRSYLGFEISKSNFFFKLFYLLGIVKNLILLFFFYIKIQFTEIIISHNKELINDDNGLFEYNFLSSQKNRRFKEIAAYLSDNFIDNICYQNLVFNYRFARNKYKQKNKTKYMVLNKIIIYAFKFPFMAKHYKQMFQALYIYYYFKENALKKNMYSLAKEIYSMESRSLAIASAEINNLTYVIQHNKFEALPYKMYSLNIKNEPIFVETLLNPKEKIEYKNINSINSISSNTIVIQASDSCGSSISSYEFNCYEEIIHTLKKIKFKGIILFKFHPANIKFFVNLKIKICNHFLNKDDNIKFKFLHKEENIEFYAKNSNLLLSIDYSTSFLNILNMGIPTVYFNKNLDRHVINSTSNIYKFKNFKMVSSKNKLEEILTILL